MNYQQLLHNCWQFKIVISRCFRDISLLNFSVQKRRQLLRPSISGTFYQLKTNEDGIAFRSLMRSGLYVADLFQLFNKLDNST